MCGSTHQTASPGPSKLLPAVFLSCTGAWHGGGTLGGQTLRRAWLGAHGDRLPAEAACSFQPCNRTQSSFANLPLKWLPVFLRVASVCRSAEFPSEPLGSRRQPPCRAPLTGGSEVSSRSTQTHAHTPRHAHTHRHPHTQECIHKGACVLIYIGTSFLMLLVGWL